jgi:hypothetical protein
MLQTSRETEATLLIEGKLGNGVSKEEDLVPSGRLAEG